MTYRCLDAHSKLHFKLGSFSCHCHCCLFPVIADIMILHSSPLRLLSYLLRHFPFSLHKISSFILIAFIAVPSAGYIFPILIFFFEFRTLLEFIVIFDFRFFFLIHLSAVTICPDCEFYPNFRGHSQDKMSWSSDDASKSTSVFTEMMGTLRFTVLSSTWNGY